MISTACRRGFVSEYRITKEHLFLSKIYLSVENGNYLPINGKDPVVAKSRATATYRGLRLEVPFTGAIRLAKDFIWARYVHMGFQQPSAFEAVIDVLLENGEVKEIIDRSAEVAALRANVEEDLPPNDTLDALHDVRRRFSLDLDLY